MIYTVTFNPSLDYIVSVDDFKLGLTNRTSSELMLPGGKGINVSTVLMNLGIENTALGFTAGFVGKEIIRRLHEMGVKSEFIQISEGVSRINLKLKSIDGTEINGAGPVISKDKVEELMKKLEELGEGDVLFLAGSIPSSMPDDMYEQIMARLNGKGVMIVVDATKDLLVNVLKYHPFLVKPNNHELGEIFGVELKTRKDVISYGKKAVPVSPEMIEPLVRISISPTHGSKSFRRCVMIASPAVAVSMFDLRPIMPREGMSNSSRTRSPFDVMFLSVPLRLGASSITVPEQVNQS